MMHVQAYFHNENEAEDVRIRLQAYPVESLEIGALDAPLDRAIPLLVPFGLAGGTTAATGAGAGYVGGANETASAAGAYAGLRSVDVDSHDANGDGRDDRSLNYVLSVKVAESELPQVLDVIRQGGGHVEQR